MIKVIGITGGIGSGKTTLSNYLTKIGFAVHESDKVVLSMYNKPKKSFINFLKKNISKDVVKQKNIYKKKIAEIVFNNQKTRKMLENYIHKEVRTARESFIKKNHKNKKGVIFVDIPLMFEKNLEKNFNIVLCVIAKKEIRAKRVLEDKKFTKETLNKIFKSQTTDKERKNRSQIIIYNNKTKKDFIFSIKKTLKEILK